MKRKTLVIVLMSFCILTSMVSAETKRKTTDVRARTVKKKPALLTGNVTVTSASNKAVNVIGGAKPVTVTLSGANLNLITSAVLVSKGWPVKGTKVVLGPATSSKRNVSFYADTKTKPAGNCQLRLTAGKQVINVPANIISMSVGRAMSAVETPTIQQPEVPGEVYNPAPMTAVYNQAVPAMASANFLSTVSSSDTMIEPKDAAKAIGVAYVEIEGIGNGRMTIFEFHLETKTEVVQYEELDQTRRIIRKKPGMTMYSEITFVREVDEFSKQGLYPWWKTIQAGEIFDKRSGSIICCRENGQEFHRINFFEAWPSRIENRYVYHNNKYILMEEIGIVTEKVEFTP